MNQRPTQLTRVILLGPEDVAQEAAHRIVKIAEEVLGRGQDFRLVLSGGTTPKHLYEILGSRPFCSRLPWHRVHFFWADERCVRPDHPGSNYRMAYEAFLKNLSIPDANIHRMRGEDPDPHAAAREYEEIIRAHYGLEWGDSPPSFDLVLLGIGPDGHTASLFPETPALYESDRWVVAQFVPQLKSWRLTLTPLILNRARQVLFLVTGAAKAKTLAEVLEGPYRPYQLPAQLIRPVQGQLLWLIDQDAASCLQNSSSE